MKTELPNGDGYWKDMSIEKLVHLFRNTKDPKQKMWIKAAMHRKQVMPIRRIAELIGMGYSAVRDRLWRMHNEGIAGLFDRKPKRPWKARLTKQQFGRLDSYIMSGPASNGYKWGVWTARGVAQLIRDRFGKEYSVRQVQNILHRLNYTVTKPRPRHPKAASKEEIAEFKRLTQEQIRYWDKKGYTVVAVDEYSHIIGYNLQYGWHKKGSRPVAETDLGTERLHVFGALTQYKGLFYEYYERNDAPSFCDFLEYVYKACKGPILVFADNASYHRAEEVQQLLDDYKGEIQLKYFPPYTPELNPIEMQWRLHKKATGNMMFGDLDEAKKHLDAMLKSGDIKIAKMFKYLRVGKKKK